MARSQKSQQIGITRHQGILDGKPIIRGTRLSVEFILDLLAAGMTPAAVAREYRLPRQSITAALANVTSSTELVAEYEHPRALRASLSRGLRDWRQGRTRNHLRSRGTLRG